MNSRFCGRRLTAIGAEEIVGQALSLAGNGSQAFRLVGAYPPACMPYGQEARSERMPALWIRGRQLTQALKSSRRKRQAGMLASNHWYDVAVIPAMSSRTS